MMKRFLALFITILLTISCTFAVFAAEDRQRVYDKAGLFSSGEITELERKLGRAVDKTGLDFVILTTSDKDGATLADYADDFYDYGGFGTDADHSGLIMLIDMQDRTVYMGTTGKACDYLTDKRINDLTDDNDELYEYLADERYADAAAEFIGGVEDYVRQGIPGARKLTFLEILLALIIPGLAAFFYIRSIQNQYAMTAEKRNIGRNALAFSADSSFAFAVNEDDLLHHSLTFRTIPRTSGSTGSGNSGGSTMHKSHSGTLHGGGGGGRHF